MKHKGSLPCSQEPATDPFTSQMIQFTPSYPISLISILMLSSHLPLRLPSGLFRSIYPTGILYAFLISPMRAA